MECQPVTYQLVIRLAHACRVEVGRLGIHEFAPGIYVYTGSAKRSLEARIRRHLSAEKRLRWHIDYLLAQPDADVVNVIRYAELECIVNARTAGSLPMPGFGASDCRQGCRSHLKFQGESIAER